MKDWILESTRMKEEGVTEKSLKEDRGRTKPDRHGKMKRPTRLKQKDEATF